MNNANLLKEYFEKHWIMLAPMAGVNDLVFRQLCIENGAMLTYTEMVSSKALSYKNPKTKNLLQLASNEKKVVVQLFGHEPKVMAQQALNIEKTLGNRVAYVDINMGCPAKKIVKKDDGAALMNTPKLASDIVKACVDACDIPITVKFRRGYEIDNDTSFSFAKNMIKAGASALCIHGRYAMQFYKGNADIDVGQNLSNNLDVPVIWSGDIKDYETAKTLVDNTNLSATMIGRAARGNPWVFSKVGLDDYLARIKIAKRHVVEYEKINPLGLAHMRKHCMWYVSGMPGATIARNRFSFCSCLEDYLKVFDELKERIEENATRRL